ncbi:protease modulator HflC [Motilimonas cestriensis]|uniref:Protein HflC n=1 Tax=Motilimonas cestriensis TaxID=2742685 RepID=A0ABS8W854_9GAMM|nr:protease modulator HflC [Motilimonas cestriensis]MCE2595169.1 protease modulator HflC [Motilimonas cestriensis]
MKKLILIILAATLLVGFSSVFVVQEGHKAIVIKFGKVQRDADGMPHVFEPGLHFKLPLFETIRTMDARIQTLDDASDRFVTSEKKDLIINSYVKWEVEDFAKFYLATGGNFDMAADLLKRKVGNALRNEIGARTIKEIVSGERDDVMINALKVLDGTQNAENTAKALEDGVEAGRQSSDELGVRVLDVRIKQIELPTEVRSSIYKRMRAERAAVAKEHRSQGQEKATIIRANIDRKVAVMLADANRKSREMRGDGDALAAKIYADTYGKDPEFYAFIRSLDAYRDSFKDKSDVMVLSPDSEFFRYMDGSIKQP